MALGSGADSAARQALRARFLRGSVRLLILHSALQGPVYGWSLQKALRAWGAPISTGALYPILNTLERGGWLQRYPTAPT